MSMFVPNTARARVRALIALIGAALLCGALFGAAAPVASATSADLTRFGPKDFLRHSGPPTTTVESFTASDGPGTLEISGDGISSATVRLNGEKVLGTENGHGHHHHGWRGNGRHRDASRHGDGNLSVPVTLAAANTLEVSLRGKPGSSITARIKQHVDIGDLNITSVFHVGINVRDFEQQHAFYDTLGFESEINPAGPETNTPEVTETQGLPFYRLAVSLNSLNNLFAPPYLDTVQYFEPYREDPTYASPNHLGLAFATYGTTDLGAAVDYLKAAGIEFISAPATTVSGQRFAILKDPQGTFFKLVQAEGVPSGLPDSANLTEFEQVGINVSDMDRSREFYKIFGFTESNDSSETGKGEAAQAWGQTGRYAFRGQDLSLPGEGGGPSLQLQEWKKPYDPQPPYPLPINHLGIDRVDLATSDLLDTVAKLRELGIPQVGPIAPCCSGPESTFGIANVPGPRRHQRRGFRSDHPLRPKAGRGGAVGWPSAFVCG